MKKINFDRNIITGPIKMLDGNNPLAKVLKRASDWFKEFDMIYVHVKLIENRNKDVR